MIKETTHKTEYDFCLRYKGKAPFQIGDMVKSGTSDDYGQMIEFPGHASVVACEQGCVLEQRSHASSPDISSFVYVKSFPVFE